MQPHQPAVARLTPARRKDSVRTDTSEQRGQNDDPPPLDATQSRQRHKNQLDALSIRVSNDPGSDIDEVLRLIAEQACLATAATSAAIAIRHEDEIVCRAIAGPNTPDLGAALNISTGLSGACVRTKQAQYCEDTDSDFRVNAEACRRLQVRSVLVVPLLKKDELVGVFEIFSPLPQAFARHDLQNLQALAHVVLDTLEPPRGSQVSSLTDADPAGSFTEVSPPPKAAPPAPVAAPKEAPIAKSLATAPAETNREPAVVQPVKKKEEAPPAAVVPLRPVQTSPPRVAVSPVKAPEVRPEPAARASAAVQSPALKPAPPGPAAKPSPAFLRADEPAVQSFLSLPAGPHSPAQDPLPSLTAPPDREWMSTILTVSVVSLALILGWMLGRAGWERAMGSRTHSPAPASEPAGAAQGHAAAANNSDDSDPIMAGPGDRTPASDPHSSHAASSPAKPAADQSQNGGLTVYQSGKIIFQQSARNANAARNSSEPPPVEVSSQVASAHLIQRVEPVYPELARENFVQGEVVLEAVIGKDGVVQELKPISGDPQLIAAAATAVQQWRFRPYEPQGKPVNFSTRFTVNFRLH